MLRPKIALVTPGSFPIPSARSSSVEHVVAELAQALAAHADVSVYGIRAPGYRPLERREEVTYIRSGRRKGYVASLIRHLRRGKYDVIQVENRPRIARRIKKMLPHTPVWLSLHSLTFVSPKRIASRDLADCFRRADRIVVNSEFLKEELTRMIPAAAEKIRVNVLGVNLEQFTSRWSWEGEQLREAMLSQHGLCGRKIILYVGRLIGIKGVHHLMEAMRRIAPLDRQAVLVVVGGAFYGSKRTTAYVRRLHRMGKNMPGQVIFIPYVPHDRVQEWFRTADVVVVPSSRREAFGLVNVEAMAAGVPVIATRAGGMKEIIEHERTGLLVSPDRLEQELADSVMALLANDQTRRSMGEAGLERVREWFTWQQCAERWLGIYRDFIGCCEPLWGPMPDS